MGICLSGAGPTILALATNNFDTISDTITKVFLKHNVHVIVKVLNIVDDGAQVVE